jgi:hypothetical protein
LLRFPQKTPKTADQAIFTRKAQMTLHFYREIPVNAKGRGLSALNPVNSCAGRPLPEPGEKFFKCFRASFRPNFHVPFRGIAYPARQPETAGLGVTGVTETYPLHPSFHQGAEGGAGFFPGKDFHKPA